MVLAPEAEEMKMLGRGGVWGLSVPGTRLNTITALFPRVDVKKRASAAPKKERQQKDAEPAGKKGADRNAGIITFEDFQGVELRVARVLTAERVAKSERLLKLSVAAPEERTIVAGIA